MEGTSNQLESEPNADGRNLCPHGYSGWESRNECTEFYYCSEGVAGVIRACENSLLFDKEFEVCNAPEEVCCGCEEFGESHNLILPSLPGGDGESANLILLPGDDAAFGDEKSDDVSVANDADQQSGNGGNNPTTSTPGAGSGLPPWLLNEDSNAFGLQPNHLTNYTALCISVQFILLPLLARFLT